MKNFILAFLLAANVSAVNYFVSGTGNDNNSGTSASPFRQISKAAALTGAGDTVWCLAGTYSPITITSSGTLQKQIIYRTKSGAGPLISFSGWAGITINANYIIIDGLSIIGNNSNVTLAGAVADAILTEPSPLYNGAGICITNHHHITIRNCNISNCGGGGIATGQADYIKISGCTVFKNAWYSRYAESGISLWENKNSDTWIGYHNQITSNTVYENMSLVKWSVTGNYSDGNGIIIDGDIIYNYTGRTLISSNTSYLNGGSGIHCYKAHGVDMLNNTVFLNAQKVPYAGMFANSSNDVVIKNNIIISSPGKPSNENWNNSNVIYDYNIYKGGLIPVVKGTHDTIIN